MKEYQLGFVHACKVIRSELEKNNVEIPESLDRLFDHVKKEEVNAIKKSIGL